MSAELPKETAPKKVQSFSEFKQYIKELEYEELTSRLSHCQCELSMLRSVERLLLSELKRRDNKS